MDPCRIKLVLRAEAVVTVVSHRQTDNRRTEGLRGDLHLHLQRAPQTTFIFIIIKADRETL